MDIAYLLWLQGLREALPSFVEQFFVVVSAIAASSALVVVPCLIYWCVDKRAGQFVVLTFSLGTFVNQLIKNTVCCYRPWIRSAAISPAEAALPEATGYSFPSGHTQASATLLGSVGHYFRRHRALAAVCWAFVLLVGFSRNFLGVHTPQDVVVALLESAVIIALANPALAWLEEHPDLDGRVLAATLAAVFAYLAYVAIKPYPMDYDSAGRLLVDPVQMQVDCFKSAGVLAGFAVGWFLERRFLGFEVDAQATLKAKALRLVIGLAVVAAFHLCAHPLRALGIDERVYELVKYFLTVLAAAFVAPAAFCSVERRR